jgi:ABC-type transport system involved in multi-copper enzyme maturation permease subunit
MKFRETFHFEFAYQIRRILPWLYFGLLTIVAYAFVTENYVYDARSLDLFVNAPIIIANITVFSSLIWLLAAGAIAGSAAARDVQTRMFPLTYTSPVSKATYLGGRFLAALVLNALILLAVPAGILIAVYSPDVEPEILGPFRPGSFITAYAYIALPNAFVATAVQFAFATLTRRPIASYLGSMLLWVAAYIAGPVVFMMNPDMGKLVDPIFVIGVGELTDVWTPIEQNTRMIALEGPLLLNRLIWVGIALGMLALTHIRFRLAQPTAKTWGGRIRSRRGSQKPVGTDTTIGDTAPIPVPEVTQNFGFATRLRQTSAIGRVSFLSVAKSGGGLIALSVIAALVVLILPLQLPHMSIPLLPRTGYLLTYLTAPLANPATRAWMIIPLLIIFYAGELVWREREAGLGDIIGAAPVPEWVSFLGKFLGLSLLLMVWQALLTIAGVLTQASMGYTNFELGLYLKVMFGLQLIDYVLFALLALVIHVVVNQKHLGHLFALIIYGYIAFAPLLGIELRLLVYGSEPGWAYTDMRGFGPYLTPWLWFKLYWVAWALVLSVVARLAWVRGRDSGIRERLRTARRRFTGRTAGMAAVAASLVIAIGGFIIYNTHVLNEYQTGSDAILERAEYERRYAQYHGLPQPRLTGVNLRVEIYPDSRSADIRGSYQLVNATATPIELVHLSLPTEGEMKAISFDRTATPTVTDDELRQRIYSLDQPLGPGESLRMDFELHSEPHGFGNGGADALVVQNGSYITDEAWMPALGYQLERELTDPGERRAQGLVERSQVPALDDARALVDKNRSQRINFEAVIGTKEGQTAIAPGELREVWTERGRGYFHYSTGTPIPNGGYAIFSADYAVKEVLWNDVAIQMFHHRGHEAGLGRIAESARASLEYHTREYAPYPHRTLRFIENPVRGLGAHADAVTIDYGETFSLMNPGNGPRDVDFVFAVAAHEMAHQWWGNQLVPARVEGAPLISETLAWYSAMQVVEQTYGPEHMRRLLDIMRVVYESPRSRASVPLLRAADWFQGYRKGPFAMHAMREYIGAKQVNQALRNLLKKHGPGTFPLPTSLDLYRELQAVTPPEYQYLLHDLFEANTFWELDTKVATAEKTEAGTWLVTLEVEAGKVAVDPEGNETVVPMNDWIEVGVFAPADAEEKIGNPLYLEKHRILSGRQTITVTVPSEPANAGIDPNYLLIDVTVNDNIRKIKVGPFK